MVKDSINPERPPKEMPTRSSGGCTATCVLITQDKIYCANAGDSRTVVSRDGGPEVNKLSNTRKSGFEELSEDHKPDSEVEKARIQGAGGKVILSKEVPNGRIDG